MTPIAHALLPAIAAHACLARGAPRQPLRHLALIATAGILPDLLTPHTHLADRWASGPHTLVAALVFYFCLRVFGSARPHLLPAPLAGWMGFAYALHIACDSITCGTVPFRPFSNVVVGADTPWAPTWFIADALSLLLASRLGLFRLVLTSLRRKRRAAAAPRALPAMLAGAPASLSTPSK